jgi:transposase
VIRRVAERLGVHSGTVRPWVKRAPTDRGGKAGRKSDQPEELKALRRENAELRRANEIIKAASAHFAKELDRLSSK